MSREITQLLLALDSSKASIDKLFPLVYEELQQMAHQLNGLIGEEIRIAEGEK